MAPSSTTAPPRTASSSSAGAGTCSKVAATARTTASSSSTSGTMMKHSPLLRAFMSHSVSAAVIDLDHYRIHGGMAVETDYIVAVRPSSSSTSSSGGGAAAVQAQKKRDSNGNEGDDDDDDDDDETFDEFLISKTYAAFRTMAYQLKRASDKYTGGDHGGGGAGGSFRKKKKGATGLSEEVVKVAKFCELATHLVESQKPEYLGKVNYAFVKAMAKQRSRVVNDVLEATVNYFPEHIGGNSGGTAHHPLLSEVASIVETFFLTDHCEEMSSSSIRSCNNTISGVDHRRGSSGGGSVAASGGAGGGKKDAKAAAPAPAPAPAPAATKTAPATSVPALDPTTTAGAAAAGAVVSSSDATAKTKTTATAAPTAMKMKRQRSRSVVIPITRRSRRPDRAGDDDDLKKVGGAANLLVDDDDDNDEPRGGRRQRQQRQRQPDYNRPRSVVQPHTATGTAMENSPVLFVAVAVLSLYFLRRCSDTRVSTDLDVALLAVFAAFCLGLHCPRPLLGGYDTADSAVGTVVRMMPTSSSNGGKHSSAAAAAGGSRGGAAGATATADGDGDGGSSSSPRRRFLQRSSRSDVSGRRLLRQSMIGFQNSAAAAAAAGDGGGGRGRGPTLAQAAAMAAVDHDHDDAAAASDAGLDDWMLVKSPLDQFPDSAKIGTVMNCWSEPVYTDFKVRGGAYLTDHKKVASGPFLFPNRGVDLFLTDTCPENVGSNASVLGGRLRDVPTFVINFRLPWGVLIFYFEIPARFVPFVRARYEPAFDRSTLPDVAGMSAGERTAARFLLGDDHHKNSTLKIVPIVVDGPWVVKAAVGGKPAIVGNKLPITYLYEPAAATAGGKTYNNDNNKKALYLEADLDIAASSAARGILSVTRTYTNILTLDLGFVVQGNAADELPEQMLTGTRMHGIDPLTASPLPPMNNIFLDNTTAAGADDTEVDDDDDDDKSERS